MSSVGKRMSALREQIEDKDYGLDDAVQLVKSMANAKFKSNPEGVDVALSLGVDPRRHTVRGAVVLPHGTGRSVRVAVFADGEQAKNAEKAGAHQVGMKELADDMKKGNLDFDVVIATPDAMKKVVGALGKVLGPKGLMPNPKVGTVSTDVASAVERSLKGQVSFRLDKGGILHCNVGRSSFEVNQLSENIQQLIREVKRLKPAASKGKYMKRLTLSSTMGPSVEVDLSSVTD